MYCFHQVRDVTFCLDSETGLTTILVMSSSGHVYTQPLNEESQAVHGSFYITNALEINHEEVASQVMPCCPFKGFSHPSLSERRDFIAF